MMDEIRFIDLFSGIGGFRLGLEKTNDISPKQLSAQSRGWNENTKTIPNGHSSSLTIKSRVNPNKLHYRHAWSCDFNKYANQIYTKQFGNEEHHSADIRGVNPEEIPDFDLLCAGFPCQAFSVAGKRKGFEDTRGTLFFEICRIAEAKRPSLLLLENVKGLLNHDRGRTFTVILQTLDELGYWLEWQVLNSKHFGVPQNRERVFIVGHLRGTGRQEIFPITEGNGIPSKELRGRKGIASALDANYYKGARRQRTFIASELQKIGNIAESGHDSLWGRVYDPEGIAMNLNAEGGGLGAKTGLYAIPVLTPDRPEKRQHGRRFKEDGEPSFTLTGQDKHGVLVPDIANTVDQDGYLRFGQRVDGTLLPIAFRRIRKLTPVECERLQGFPDGWTKGISDTQRYKCLGNAVTVNVTQFLGNRILSLFTNNRGQE